MTEKGINNNQVEVAGEIISTFEYSHEIFGEGFYMVKLLVNRLSEATDEIPLMISERLVDVTKDCRGKYLRAFGQFRSYNKHEENHNHLILSVFVRDLGSLILWKTLSRIRSSWTGLSASSRSTG